MATRDAQDHFNKAVGCQVDDLVARVCGTRAPGGPTDGVKEDEVGRLRRENRDLVGRNKNQRESLERVLAEADRLAAQVKSLQEQLAAGKPKAKPAAKRKR